MRMCEYCNEPIYRHVEQYLRPVLAPATDIAALEYELLDKTGMTYAQVEPRYCHHCGRPLRASEPLTLEQLRAGGKRWVWCIDLKEEERTGWYRVDRLTAYAVGNYGKTWTAYAYPPNSAKGELE